MKRAATRLFFDPRYGTSLEYGHVIGSRVERGRREYLFRDRSGRERWVSAQHVDLRPLYPERAGSARRGAGTHATRVHRHTHGRR